MRDSRSSRRLQVRARDEQVAPFRKTSKKALLNGMNLCLRNARSLLCEAEVLAQAGARSRAFALAVLAREETGKVVLLTLISHSDRDKADDGTLRRVAKVFASHDQKLALFAENTWRWVLVKRRRRIPPVSKAVECAARRSHRVLFDFLDAGNADLGKMKLRALYVDFSRGNFLEPLSVPRRVLFAISQTTRRGIRDAETLRDYFRRARTDDLADEIMTLIEKRYYLPEVLEALKEGIVRDDQ